MAKVPKLRSCKVSKLRGGLSKKFEGRNCEVAKFRSCGEGCQKNLRAEISKLRSFEVAGRAVKESESLSGQGAEVAKLQSCGEGCQKIRTT